MNYIHPCLITLMGLPASGKSSFAKTLDESFYIHSTDNVIEKYAESIGKTYNDVFNTYVKTASKISNQNLKEAINQKKSIVWDQVNPSPKKRGKIIKQFPNDYQKICVCFLPPFNDEQEKELARRLVSRPGKSIPDSVMENMRSRFLPPSHDEGWDKIYYRNLYNEPCDVIGNKL